LLGGGAYTIPRRITALHPEKEITVAELDHTLYPLAQTYFDLEHTDRVHNNAVDARVFIAGTPEKFDFIFMDAFGSSQNIPFHLTTVEFLEQLKATLTNDGVVITNYIGMLDNEPNSLTARFMATYLSVFPNLAVYQTAPRPYDTIQNTIIVAHNDPTLNPDISDFMVRDNATGTTPIRELEVPLAAITSSEARLLTDNDAPTEYLTAKQLQRYLEARK
jgi:spermidine synthase